MKDAGNDMTINISKQDKIPNCRQCEWIHYLMFEGEELKECGGQGYELACKVYKKRMCRNLYRKKSKPVIFDKNNKRK